MPQSKLKESCQKSKWEALHGVIIRIFQLILVAFLSLRNLMEPYVLTESAEKNDYIQTVPQKSRPRVPKRRKDPQPMDSSSTETRKPGVRHLRYLFDPEQKNQKEESKEDKISRHKRSYWEEILVKKPNYKTEMRKNGRLEVAPCYSPCLFPSNGLIRLRTVATRRLPTQLKAQQVHHMPNFDRTRRIDEHHFQENNTTFVTTLAQTQAWPKETAWDYERRRKEGQQILRRLAESDALIAKLWQEERPEENGRRRERSSQRVENIPEIHDQVLETTSSKRNDSPPSEENTGERAAFKGRNVRWSPF